MDKDTIIQELSSTANSLVVFVNSIYGMILFEQNRGTFSDHIVKIIRNTIEKEFPKNIKQYQECYKIIRQVTEEDQ